MTAVISVPFVRVGSASRCSDSCDQSKGFSAEVASDRDSDHQTSIEIAAAPETDFDYLTTEEGMTAWMGQHADPAQAEMGTGRDMGPGWISVSAAAIAGDEGLEFWLGTALEHNRVSTRP